MLRYKYTPMVNLSLAKAALAVDRSDLQCTIRPVIHVSFAGAV